MDFGFTEEQDQLRSTVRAWLGRNCDSARVRAADGFDRPLWTQLTGQLGLTGLAVAEERGGAGASLVEAGIVLEEAGAALLPTPYLATVTAIAALDGSAGTELTALAEGSSIGTLAVAEPETGWDLDRITTAARRDGTGYLIDGTKEYVFDGHLADVLLVVARHDGQPALFVTQTDPAVKAILHPTLDQTRRQARLVFESTPARLVGGPAAAAHAVDLVLAALAVESVGVARASLAHTADYLNTREQFGAPLASFQALRHRVADLAVAVEAATSTAWYALRTAAESGAELPVVAPLAKAYATEVAYRVTAESIQLHGGIGFTWEHDAHLYFKRATANRLLFGDPTTLRRLIASQIF
jgi:alkylation response protein AidB-like acyl-CoA dehydrogenase